MKGLKIIWGILVMSIIPCLLRGQNEMKYTATQEFQIKHSSIDSSLLLYHLTQLIDYVIDDAHVHLPTSSGFDLPDPYQIGILGGSVGWTKYYYDQIRIDNPLRKGDAAYHFSLENTGLQIDRIENKIKISPAPGLPTLKINHTIGGIGGRIGFENWFINNISGHESAAQRQIFPLSLRPKTNWKTQIFFHNSNDNLPFNFDINLGSRQHLDQNYQGQNEAYDESYGIAQARITLIPELPILGSKLSLITGYRYRSHDLAEFNYTENETNRSSEFHATLYSVKSDSLFSNALGLQISTRNISKNAINFSRNIIDQDGEGMHPYYSDGNQSALSLYYKLEKTLYKKNNSLICINVEHQNSMLFFTPDHNNFQTTTFFQTTPDNYTPLSTYRWESTKFNAGLLENTIKLKFSRSFNRLKYFIKTGWQLNGIILKEKKLLPVAALFDAGIDWQVHKNWILGIRVSRKMNPFDINHIKYLSDDYLNGIQYRWHDQSDDQIFNQGEQGARTGTTGGRYRTISPSLGASSTFSLEIPISYLNQDFHFNILPQYRQFRGTWWTSFNGELEDFGTIITKNEHPYFLLDAPNSKYLVEPYPEGILESKNPVLEYPFYAGVTLRTLKNAEPWFFSASFTANMVVGASSFGNGVLHNSVDILSETTANPNYIPKRVGRLDADRSFISRWMISRSFNKKHLLVLQLKYKDGQSFANYAYEVFNTPEGSFVGFRQREVRGDNPLTGERGRREDFLLNVDLRYRYTLKVNEGMLNLEFFGSNLLDFGNETLEYTFGNTNGFDRAPLELQIPRSIMFSLKYTWNK